MLTDCLWFRDGSFPASWTDQPVLQEKYDCLTNNCTDDKKCGTMACPYIPSGTTAPPLDGDTQTADLTLSRLKTWAAANDSRPFFLATGLQSPRLPWSYPEHVVATRYPRGAAGLSLPKHLHSPQRSAAEDLEWFRQVEIDGYTDAQVTHDAPMDAESQRRVRLAYYAGITHVDDQVGRLLDGLVSSGVDRSTAVVLTADHSQNLGENNMWSMMSLLETSLRVPLMIRPAPAHTALGGGRAVPVYHHPVELIDLFPTLTSLAGLPPPPKSWKLVGSDLTVGMLTAAVVKPLDAAFSQITRCKNCTRAYPESYHTGESRGCVADPQDTAFAVPCAHTPRAEFDWMGMTVRQSDWRYSTFCRWDGATLSADWERCQGAELYNHTSDTSLYDVDDNGEPFNLAGLASTRAIEGSLHALLRRRFATVKADEDM